MKESTLNMIRKFRYASAPYLKVSKTYGHRHPWRFALMLERLAYRRAKLEREPVDRISTASELCAANWRAGRDRPVEVTEEVYWYALEAVPPVYGKRADDRRGVFWLGEPWDHDARGPIGMEFWFVKNGDGGERYFARVSHYPEGTRL